MANPTTRRPFPVAMDPVTLTEYHADPHRLPLGDLWREQSTLQLALERCTPGRADLIRRLCVVEGAILAGGAR